MAANQTIRPLVPTTIRTEFGEVLESDVFNSPYVGRDLTFVPGYSDMRRARDKALGEVSQGTRRASEVPTLPVRLQWVRATRVSGTPDSVKQVQYGVEGYRLVTKADIGTDWLKSMPAGAVTGAGDEIHQGDCVLMVTDKQTAARRVAEHRRNVDNMTKTGPVSDLMKLGSRTQGSDPTFESTPGPQVPVPKSAIKA